MRRAGSNSRRSLRKTSLRSVIQKKEYTQTKQIKTALVSSSRSMAHRILYVCQLELETKKLAEDVILLRNKRENFIKSAEKVCESYEKVVWILLYINVYICTATWWSWFFLSPLTLPRCKKNNNKKWKKNFAFLKHTYVQRAVFIARLPEQRE